LGENLELILKIINFGISNILCDYTKYRMSFLEKEVCNYIPDIRKLGIPDITEDEFYKLIGLTRQEINQIKNPLTKEDIEEDDEEDVEEDKLENDGEEEPKKTPIKLDEKIVLVPATEAIPSPIPKKKRTIKNRPKLILVESSDDKVVPDPPIDPNAEKIFNPLTNRHVKNTLANRKKIEQQTLKRGGKSKKRTRKNKGNKC
jgi:hypothetical protein